MQRIKFPPVVNLWLELLRSGEFKPGPGIKLCQHLAGEWRWSSLGILAEAGVRKGIGCSQHDGGKVITFCVQGVKSIAFPPVPTVGAALLATKTGVFRFMAPGETEPRETSLWRLGGTKFTFAEIAEIIEANPDGLFLPPVRDQGSRIGSGSVYDLSESLFAKLLVATD